MNLYVKAEARALTDHRFLSAGPEAFAMFFRGLMYSKTHLTDGFVPEGALALIGFGVTDLSQTCHKLVTFGLWEKVDGGYTVGQENWAEHQTTRDQVEDKRRADAERQRTYRESKRVTNEPVTHLSQDCHAVTPVIKSETESETEEKKEAKASKEKPPASDTSPTDLFELLDSGFRTTDTREAWDRWLAYRRARKLSAYTLIGFKQTASKLRATFSDSGGRADPKALIEGINHSMANNWAGIFKPKDDSPIRSPANRRESPMEVAHGAAQILAQQRETARNSS